MSKIPLRVYIRNIDDLIAQEAYQKAFIQARHVLYHFPKYLEAYRVLGKAYLEARQYGDALEVFQRLLSAVPEDFLAHAAMSIIREEEGDLDSAIWHMERAFEAQPANLLIQEELQRLYRERDGIAPPRIRLTRAALARIYLRSGMYPQAILELEALLQAQPRRYDLQGFLAEAYEKAGQDTKALEVAARLLRILPYHWRANWVMVRVLRRQGRGDEAERYWERIVAMEPYAAYVSDKWPTPEQVPDEMVTLGELAWDEEDILLELEDQMPGLLLTDSGLEPELLALPGDLEALGMSEDLDLDSELIPPWIEAETEEAQVAPQPSQAEEPESEKPALEQGDIPEWLQALAPEPKVGLPEGDLPEEDLSWLEEALAQTEEAESLVAPVLKPKSEETLETEETPTEEPTWLQEETQAVPMEMEEEAPTWLQEVAATPEETVETEAVDVGEMPEWLKEMAPEAETEEAGERIEATEIPDWLKEAMPEPETETTAEGIEEDEIPDWLKEVAPETEGEAFVTQEEAEIPEWLQEAAPEAVAETPEAEAEALEEVQAPEWLQEAAPEAVAEVPEAEAEVEAPEAAEPAKAKAGLLEDEDAALAWLEALAAKAGVPEEELLTKPEERREEVPTEALAAAGEEGPEAEALEEVQAPEWLQEAAPETVAETPEAEAEALEAAQVPEWLQEAAPEAVAETPEAEAEALEEVQAPEWLQEAAPEAEKEAPPEPDVEPPTWIRAEEDLAATERLTKETLPSWDLGETAPLDPETVQAWLEKELAPEAEKEAESEAIASVIEAPEREAGESVLKAQEPPTSPLLEELPPGPEGEMLREARAALFQRDLDTALPLYRKLIRRKKLLEYVIEDLFQAQYDYPMNVDILILLGDAYAKAGRLQEALDTYWKAEQLVR